MKSFGKILIQEVITGSAAQEAGIDKGDMLLSVNGCTITDILDYRFHITDEFVTLEIEKPSGEIWDVEIEKGENEDPGLVFERPLIDSPKACRNKCVFCFMDQLAPGMRKSLHFKDDDYRLSFLEGNYVTLTNVSHDELDRIIRYRLSPVNVSVHTTNPELRKKMMNNPNAGNINEYLTRLYNAGLDINCQIVLCRNINDGQELDRSIEDLAELHPRVKSISVVPVGLTRYRNGLYPLEGFDKSSSLEVIKQVEACQFRLKKELGTSLVYLADEFYINAGVDIPSYKHYEDFYQLENGVGMVALFKYQFNKCLGRLKYNMKDSRAVSMVTGVSPVNYLAGMIDTLKKKYARLEVYLYPIENNFFGSRITVTGLVTGKDIIEHLKGKELGDELLVPSVMLKGDEGVFLDDISLDQLGNTLGIKVRKVDNTGKDFIRAILNLNT